MPTFTDSGNAERLIQADGWRLRYSPSLGWLVWDGQVWQRDDLMVVPFAQKVARRIAQEIPDGADEKTVRAYQRWAMTSLSAAKLSSMIQLARSEPTIKVDPDQLDPDPFLLNCRNAVVDLRTGMTAPRSPDSMFTCQADVVWNPEAQAPLWLQFIDQITCSRPDLGAMLQQAAGYSLTGLTSERSMFIPYGSGHNGKSVFLETLRDMMGTYADVIPTWVLTTSDHSASERELARVRGTRMITATEAVDVARLNDGLVKSLTGDERLSARFLYQESFTYRPRFTFWLGTNHMPNLRSVDLAIRERLQLLPFDLYLPRECRDGDLKEKLARERSGILNWAVEGCLRWLTREKRIEVARASKDLSEAYFAEQDQLGRFLEECTTLSLAARVASVSLYEVYRAWSEVEGASPIAHRTFSTQMRERSYRSMKSDGKIHWLDIELVKRVGDFKGAGQRRVFGD